MRSNLAERVGHSAPCVLHEDEAGHTVLFDGPLIDFANLPSIKREHDCDCRAIKSRFAAFASCAFTVCRNEKQVKSSAQPTLARRLRTPQVAELAVSGVSIRDWYP